MVTDPRFAPQRTDLPWLRRRRLPRPPVSAASAPSSAAPVHEAVNDFLAGHATRRAATSGAPTPARPPVAPSAPTARSSSIDLSRPTPPTPPARSSLLDLSRPTSPAPPSAPSPPPPPSAPARSGGSSLLDLSEPEPAPPPAVPRAAASTPRRQRSVARVRAGERHLLTVNEPTVTLTRLQSAIGTLSFEAAVGSTIGELRIGCAYELSSRASSTVQLAQGNRLAPPRSRRPLLVAARDRFETIGVDLRQSTDLRRLVVYAFSENRTPLAWGGTLIATTFGGARVELPLESLQSGDSAVLMSLYNVRGEFVLRAEMQTLFGDVRECCRAYGFDRITWLDDRTPVE